MPSQAALNDTTFFVPGFTNLVHSVHSQFQ